MAKERKNKIWSREETIIAFNVYCKLPFKDHRETNPEVQKYAKLIGRTPDAVKMKIANFWRLDPALGKGLPHGGKMDKKVWDEFHGNWKNLVDESERLIAEYAAAYAAKHPSERIADVAGDYETTFPRGEERERVVLGRVNQSFFREGILSSYKEKCCITGLKVPGLLIASHIIPWSVNEQERLNLHNGLCLNALHDKAFDRGLITVSTEHEVVLSSEIRHLNAPKTVKEFFGKFDGKKITMPEKFFPEKKFLEHHNEKIFLGR